MKMNEILMFDLRVRLEGLILSIAVCNGGGCDRFVQCEIQPDIGAFPGDGVQRVRNELLLLIGVAGGVTVISARSSLG